MRFITAYVVGTTLFFTSKCFGITNIVPGAEVSSLIELPATFQAPELPQLLKRVSKLNSRPKFTKRPRPHPQPPHHHPHDCTVTNLVQNGNFDKTVKGWEFLPGFIEQFFWIQDSKTRPAHSGAGQAYLFLNRGANDFFLTTTVPAMEYGNSINVTAWLRLGSKVDLSDCTLLITDNSGVFLTLDLSSNWTSYSFEVSGTGRPTQIQFRGFCDDLSVPVSIYFDDVSANACIPKNPNPDCQVLAGADNFLVNPGFECPDGITAWTGSSLYGGGSENITQFSGQKGNPTHSGNGMAGIFVDSSQLPYPGSGIVVYQYDINDDMKRTTVKASFWLSADSKLHNVTSCLLSVGTNTGYYVTDLDISNLATKWTQYEIKGIVPTGDDAFQISIYGCSSLTQPLIYLDDVYFGVDRSAPPVPTTTTQPTTTPTAGPCTSTPFLVDPSFELGHSSNWLFFDQSPNYDSVFLEDESSTYGPPHSGSGVGVLDFPTNGGSASLLQQIFGLCNEQAYTATAWFYISSGYDPSLCTVSLIISTVSSPVKATAAGVWTKVQFAFLGLPNFLSPYITIDVECENTSEMIVLINDLSFGPPPACSVIPTISDGGFESGNLTIWDAIPTEGDETFTITNANPRTGKKSGVLAYPSISNGILFGRDFNACVGGRYTFHMWYYMPKAYKGTSCTVLATAWYTGETVTSDISAYNQWVELNLDFVSGAAIGHVDFGISCLNQLQKVVIYIDDVSVTTR